MKGMPDLGGVAERGGDAGVGHGDDEVGGDAGLARELAAHLLADSLHPAAEDAAVRAGEVDVLEDAAGWRDSLGGDTCGEVTPSSETMTSSPGSTSRSYLACSRSKAQVSEAKTKVSGAPFVAGDAAHGERAEAVWVARGEDAVARHHDDGEGAFDLGERVGDAVDQRGLLGVRDELDDDLGVGGGLEDGAVALEAWRGGCRG